MPPSLSEGEVKVRATIHQSRRVAIPRSDTTIVKKATHVKRSRDYIVRVTIHDGSAHSDASRTSTFGQPCCRPLSKTVLTDLSKTVGRK
jgi:hypothetical protein